MLYNIWSFFVFYFLLFCNSPLHKLTNFLLIDNIFMLLIKKGQKEKALENILIATKLAPFDAEIFYDTGIIYSDLKDNKNAIEYFRKATKLDTEYAVAYNNLCFTMALENQFEEALPYCQKALILDNKSFATYDSLGFVYAGLKNYEKAIENFETALKLNNKIGEIYFHLAQALEATEDYSNAITNYQIAKELDKNFKSQATKAIKNCQSFLK